MREKRVSVRILIIEFYYGYEECDDYRGQLGGTGRPGDRARSMSNYSSLLWIMSGRSNRNIIH
jgi:hypothetical protein